ncbi:MAG TPA: sigma-70 family RNA polymerase sigma factor [Phycisphaerae bacterium]|nr:sigma-70 family RNA polymerase sigma factor [Phycisphaerae bacterium]
MDDETLVGRYAAGEAEAFHELVRRHSGWMYAVARRQTGDPATAEDVTQAVFMLLARVARGMKRARVSGWLFRATCHTARAANRARRRRSIHERKVSMRSCDISAAEHVEQAEFVRIIDVLVMGLPARDRTAVLLRFYQGLTLREVGEALGTSEDGAGKQVERALGRLRKKLARKGMAWSMAGLAAVTESAKAAPMGLAGRVASGTLTGRAAPAILRLAKGARRTMGRKTLAVKGLGAMLAVATVAVWVFCAAGRAADVGQREMRVTVVDDATGKAVSGATVEYGFGVAARSVVAGADGVAEVPLPAREPTDWDMETSSPGYLQQETMWMDSPRIRALPAESQVRLSRGEQIGGIVVDAQGKAVGGAHVLVQARRARRYAEEGSFAEDKTYETVTTDGQGMWHSVCPIGEGTVCYVAVHGDGWYLPTTEVDMSEKALPALRARQMRLVAKQAGRIRMAVTRADGTAAVGARVCVYGMAGAQSLGKTDREGKVELTDVPPGEVSGAVQVPDQAAQVIKAHVAAGETVVMTMHLAASKPLRGQVVNRWGKGIGGARVTPAWNGVDWATQTDADGRFVWPGVPGEAVQVYVDAPGMFPPKGKVMLTPEGENKIMCAPVSKVTIKATDAGTGAALSDAQATEVSGPDIYGGSGGLPVLADSQGVMNAWFFMHRSAHWLRIRAAGHVARIVGPFADDTGDLTASAALQAGIPTKGIVRGPDGQPVSGAIVARTDPRGDLEVRDDKATGYEQTRTDAAGRFAFDPQGQNTWLWVSGDEGYAWVSESEAGEIRLRPWGKLRLKIEAGDKPSRGTLFVLWSGAGGMASASHVSMDWSQVAIDDAGVATLDRVPEGKLTVRRMQRVQQGHIQWRDDLGYGDAPVAIASGKTTEVQWVGGATVTGKLDVPAEIADKWTGADSHLSAEGAALAVPAEFNRWSEREKMGWLVRHPEAPKSNPDEHQFRALVEMEPDGRFRVTNVPPGTYSLRLRISVPAPPGTPDANVDTEELQGLSQVGETICHLVVSKDGGNVDVGELSMGAVREVKVGKEAPDFTVRTLDGSAVSLSELRGKWVLVDIWATWCGPCVEETPNIKATAAAGRKEGLAVMGVTFDRDLDKAREYVKEEGMTGAGWVQAAASGWGSSEVEPYALGIPQIYLVDPHGRIVAAGLRGEGMAEKVEALMTGKR